MSNTKCPICQNNLHKINIVVSTCTNDKCKLWGLSIPNLVLESLTQAKQDLERTRKALEVGKSVLENTSSFYKSLILANPVSDINWDVVAKNFAKHSDEALEQITALEHKEKQNG